MKQELLNSQRQQTTETFSIEFDDQTASTCSHLDVRHYRPNKFQVKSRNQYVQEVNLCADSQNKRNHWVKGPFSDKLFQIPLSKQYKIASQCKEKKNRPQDISHSHKLKSTQDSKQSLGDSQNRRAGRILLTNSKRSFRSRDSERIKTNPKQYQGILKSSRQKKSNKNLQVSFSPDIEQSCINRLNIIQFDSIRQAPTGSQFSSRYLRQRPSSVRSLS